MCSCRYLHFTAVIRSSDAKLWQLPLSAWMWALKKNLRVFLQAACVRFSGWKCPAEGQRRQSTPGTNSGTPSAGHRGRSKGVKEWGRGRPRKRTGNCIRVSSSFYSHRYCFLAGVRVLQPQRRKQEKNLKTCTNNSWDQNVHFHSLKTLYFVFINKSKCIFFSKPTQVWGQKNKHFEAIWKLFLFSSKNI